VAARSERVLVHDYDGPMDPPLKPVVRDIRSAVATPILYGGEPIGVVHLWHTQPARFDEDDAKFMEALAAKASLSYGNLLRYEENRDRAERLRRRVEQLNQIFELSQMLQTSIEPVTMLEAIAYSLLQSSGFGGIVMLLASNPARQGEAHFMRVAQAGLPIDQFEANRHRTITAAAMETLMDKRDFALSESRFFPIEKIGEWYVDGIEALSGSFSALEDSMIGSTFGSPRHWRSGDLLIVPITSATGALLGAISLDRPEDNLRPDRSSVELVEIFAHQAAATLENNQLFTSSVRSAEQEARLNEVMEAIASTLDPAEIVRAIAGGAQRLVPFARLSLVLIDQETRAFERIHVQPDPDGQLIITRDRAGSLEGSAIAHTFETKADALYLLDPAERASGIQYSDLAELYMQGERTSLLIPLVSGGLALGVLHIGSDLAQAAGFDEYRDLFKRIASIAAVALVNANLFERAQARTQRLNLLNSVSLALAQSLDTENILEVSLREIMTLLGVEQARAYLIEREGAFAQAVVELPRGDFPPNDYIDMYARASLARIMRDPQPIIVERVEALSEHDPLRAELIGRELRGYMLVPITIAGQANGFFEMTVREDETPFMITPEKYDLILIIANQAAVAVLNANLLEQTLVRTRELETLLEAAQATSTTLELSEVFGSVARLIAQALDMDECLVLLYDDVEGDLTVEYAAASTAAPSHTRGQRLNVADYPARQRALMSSQVVLIREDDPKAPAEEQALMRAHGQVGRMLVPLVQGEQAIGLVIVSTASPVRAINLRDARMAQALASQAATSIENARLTTETAAQVEQAMIINELSRAISSTMDIEQMIEVVRDNIPVITNAQEVSLALYDEASGEIVFALAMREGEVITLQPRRLEQDEISLVIRQRRPLSLGGDNPGIAEVRRNLGIIAREEPGLPPISRYLGVPLISADRVVGVLSVQDRAQTRPFGLNDQRILTTIGTQLGAAIQNANLFERVSNFAQELNARVEERTAELGQERDRLDALYRITAELGQTLDMDSVLERSLGRVARTIGAEEGVVMLFDPLNERLYVRAIMRGDEFLQTREMPKLSLFPQMSGDKRGKTRTLELPPLDAAMLEQEAERLGTSPRLAMLNHPAQQIADRLVAMRRDVGRIPAARSGGEQLGAARTLIVDDLNQMPELGPELKDWGSALAVTLETNDELQGAMVFLAQAPGMFSEPQVRLVSAAATQVSAAINNADLYNLIRDQAERMSLLLRAEREEAEKNTAILEGIADGVLLADNDGSVLLFNDAAERILGIPKQIVLGTPLARLQSTIGSAAPWVRPLTDWLNARSAAARSTREERALREQERGRQPRVIDRVTIGSTIVNLYAAPVFTGEQSIGTVVVFRDITRDVEVDRMKSEFISNVSHELRTPMTSIKGYTDLMLMGALGDLTEEQRRFMTTIKSNTDRLAELVNDLLNISRLDSGEPLTLETVDLGELVRGEVAMLTTRASTAEKGLHVETIIADGLPALTADRLKVRQIVGNVVDNALNYTHPGGHVAVTVAQETARDDDGNAQPTGRLIITVADDGIGIPDSFKDRVWNRFERYEEHALVLDVAGTGLGLSIVRQLVEMHDGDVWFTSQEGAGTTFSIALPIAGPGSPDAASQPRSTPIAER
jgi:GAF domain-containing protein/nitrogen-specific signal transduction histidine kinase